MMRRNRRKNSFRTKYPPKVSSGGRRSGKNKHHLLNACRRGTSTSENLLWLDITKHNNLHKIFKNDDPEYVIMVLDRMMDMKGYKRFRGVRVEVENDYHRDDIIPVSHMQQDDSSQVRAVKTHRVFRTRDTEVL